MLTEDGFEVIKDVKEMLKYHGLPPREIPPIAEEFYDFEYKKLKLRVLTVLVVFSAIFIGGSIYLTFH